MNTPSLDKETMMNIYNYGSYYNPAYRHYGDVTNVVCDRCRRSNLDICIGWQTYDLCLKCVSDLNDQKTKHTQFVTKQPLDEIVTFMEQSQFTKHSDKTRMCQTMFTTNMEQSIFKKK